MSTAIVGSILGTAVGDALGLPYEGLSRRRAERLLGPPARYRFFFRRGMVSDDTEHPCMMAQALIAAGDDLDLFRSNFAWRLRFWLLGGPAGIGLATLKSTIRLWLGWPSDRSGVWSAGNGPAMRAAIVGATLDDLAIIQKIIRISTRMTHRDPKAEYGAFAVALAAHRAKRGLCDADGFREQLRGLLPPDADELLGLIDRAAASAARGEDPTAFVESMGWQRGVSGYVYHTVPAVLHAWFRYPTDFRAGITSLIHCGGDADTTAAIAGGILGAAVGKNGIPPEWLADLRDWPRTVAWMERLGERLASRRSGQPELPPRLPVPGLLLRNALMMAVVLFHGFRQLAPPY